MAEVSGEAPTDAELLDRWHAGDGNAGNALFERHFDALYRFFRNKVDDGIDDLLQDTLLGCVRGRERFRGEASFRTYVFAIARKVLYDHWERRARRAGDTDIGELSIEAMTTSPSGVIARAAEHRLLVRALRAIPLELQVILELHFWEDLSGPELAAILDLPEGTVRSRLRRAREQLEAKMVELAEDQRLLSSTLSGLEDWASGLAAIVREDRAAGS